MADDFTFEGMLGEEIEGAPPVATSAELRERRLSERVSINRYLYQQAQQELKERAQAQEALNQHTAELQARNEELDAFAHTVAHEIVRLDPP